MSNQGIVLCIKYPKIRFSSEVSKPPIQACDAIMSGDPGRKALEEFAIVRVHHQETAVGAPQPPSSRHIELLPIRSDAGSVATAVVLFFPEDLFCFQIERAKPAVGGRIINGVAPGVATKAPQAFPEGNIDAPHKLMVIIHIENENTLLSSAFLSGV